MNAGCAGKTEIPWERVQYLSALEVVFTTRRYTNPRLPLPLPCQLTRSPLSPETVHIFGMWKTKCVSSEKFLVNERKPVLLTYFNYFSSLNAMM